MESVGAPGASHQAMGLPLCGGRREERWWLRVITSSGGPCAGVRCPSLGRWSRAQWRWSPASCSARSHSWVLVPTRLWTAQRPRCSCGGSTPRGRSQQRRQCRAPRSPRCRRDPRSDRPLLSRGRRCRIGEPFPPTTHGCRNRAHGGVPACPARSGASKASARQATGELRAAWRWRAELGRRRAGRGDPGRPSSRVSLRLVVGRRTRRSGDRGDPAARGFGHQPRLEISDLWVKTLSCDVD